jgi:hypothetical protein
VARVFNRRNAALGWASWFYWKHFLRQKAKDAVPSVDPETKRPNKTAAALTAAGVVGALAFWRRRSGGGDGDPSSPAE